jgi:hypothetical protein
MLTHLKANAIAYAALFVALGGTSYAAVKLPAGSVGTKELRRDAVTKTRIHRDAVTSLRVLDHTLKAVDFAPGQLKAGPKGDQGPTGAKGDTGARGDVGPTLGVAGLDAGCCPSLDPSPDDPTSTKTVTLTTRARLFVLGSNRVRIQGCTSATCTKSWGLTVDGVPVAGSERRAEAQIGAEGFATLTPFGVTDVLEPGTHTIGLTQKPGTGNLMAATFAGSHLAAIALGV